MVYRGHIQKGVVVFDAPANLAEGTEVVVEPVGAITDQNGSASSAKSLQPDNGSEGEFEVSEALLRLAGSVPDLPEDASVNLDHYLYGHPKK